MEEIRELADIQELTDNTFIGSPEDIGGSVIRFKGKGNVLYCEEGVRLSRCAINFQGDNGLVILGKNRHVYNLDISINNNCSITFGRDCYFNGQFHAIASEETDIFIGDDCLFSFGVWVRTADPHLIYDAETHRRINPSRSVYIGDHVWIGQNALVLKGTRIGSGAIVGAASVVSGKTITSNSSWAGNPVRKKRDGIFWDEPCVHTWTSEMTEKHEIRKTRKFLFNPDEHTVDFGTLYAPHDSAAERLAKHLAIGYDNAQKNRFAIKGAASPAQKQRGFISTAIKRFANTGSGQEGM